MTGSKSVSGAGSFQPSRSTSTGQRSSAPTMRTVQISAVPPSGGGDSHASSSYVPSHPSLGPAHHLSYSSLGPSAPPAESVASSASKTSGASNWGGGSAAASTSYGNSASSAQLADGSDGSASSVSSTEVPPDYSWIKSERSPAEHYFKMQKDIERQTRSIQKKVRLKGDLKSPRSAAKALQRPSISFADSNEARYKRELAEDKKITSMVEEETAFQ